MRMTMPYKFKFERFPNILPFFKEYMDLKRKATAWSMKDSARAGKKYEEAAKKRDEYGETVLAKVIYDTFDPISPILTNSDDDILVEWKKVFDKPFDQLTNYQKEDLIGLIERNYIYELPVDYYN